MASCSLLERCKTGSNKKNVFSTSRGQKGTEAFEAFLQPVGAVQDRFQEERVVY